MTEGELYKQLYRVGSGALTSFQITQNMISTWKDPNWAQKGTMTRNFDKVKWQRPEYAKEVLDLAKAEIFVEWNRRPELTGELTEWKRARLAEWNLRFGALIEKWFGDST